MTERTHVIVDACLAVCGAGLLFVGAVLVLVLVLA
jgi:hypothetical protein